MSTDQLDAILHVACALVGLASLLFGLRQSPSRARRAAFALALVAGLVAYPGIDRVRGRNFLHAPELFHYVLGPKYFHELGYTGLYDAAAQASFEEHIPFPIRVRNLTTGRLEIAPLAYPRGEALSLQFRGLRWLEFRKDLKAFHEFAGTAHARAMVDHGFNGTPAWIAVAQAVVRDAPLNAERLTAYASIDVALLILMLLVFLAVFGLEETAVAALVMGTAWTWRFAWNGGSLLRYDWLVALGLALAALRKERFGLAGGLLAWATAARLFPAFFAVAAGFSLLFHAKDRQGKLALARYVLGFALVAGMAGYAGTQTGRGQAAWTEFADRIRTHHGAWASNHIGLDSIAIVDAAITSRPDPNVPPEEAFESYLAPIERARHERRPFLRLVLLGVIAAIAFAARRLPPWKAMPLGAIAIFCASAISGYYWVMLAVVPFAAKKRTSIMLVLTAPLAAGMELLGGGMTAAHIVLSFVYLAIFADWLVSVLREPDEPAAEVAAR